MSSPTLKIFHTADVHLGLQFTKYPEELSKRLRDARFETLSHMVQKANSERCQLFVVGGDLFDTTQVAKKSVVQAAKILSEFEGLVAVLPGNHDYISGTSAQGASPQNELWATFQEAASDRVLLLTEKKPYSLKHLDVDACLYPAPCQNKHSKTHAVSWIEGVQKDPEITYHIGLAHGSFEGISADLQGEYYPMKKEDLSAHSMDLWLMGHIHIQYPFKPGAADRIFYPSTPEPDGFDCRHEGRAWLLELSPEKQIQARSLSTGNHRFISEQLHIESSADLEALKTRYKMRPQGETFANCLIKLTLEGSLARDEYGELSAILQNLKEDVLFLKADASLVHVKLMASDIDSEFTSASFPHQLLSTLSANPDDKEALQLAYELVTELKRS